MILQVQIVELCVAKHCSNVGVYLKTLDIWIALRNTLEVFKCDAGEGWRIGWTGHVVRNEEMKKYYKE